MLIAINGESDNGKDLAADWFSEKHDLVKIALADPMKRFVRQLFAFPAENLWGPSAARNMELDAPPLWGRAFSQLHTMHQFTAAVVPEEYGVETRAKAFGSIQNWFTKLRSQNPEKISARTLLQTLGTEWGRESVRTDIWVNYLFDKQLPLLAEGFTYSPELGVQLGREKETVKNGICIPDIRFNNEIRAVQDRRGEVIRVRRLSRVRRDSTNVGISGHKSELEQRGIPDSEFDKVFEFLEGVEQVYADLKAWDDVVLSS